ncbi:MAG: DUF5663 domain-containing protein [Candidatus Doudnabacteria bacterium]|nr:DUF5663 domain-containing protein [Candidatus Doudnabacteria bacterium]
MANLETKNNQAEQGLRTFVDNLVAAKNFEVEPDVMEQIKADVYDRAEDIINATIMANIPPEKLEEFDKLLDGGNQQAIEEFTNRQIPNLQELTAEALTNFRNTYLGIK